MDTDYIEDIVKNQTSNVVNFWGCVEDNLDPLGLGRVKVRCFHYHSDNAEEIPTEALPWAIVLQPTNSSSNSGIGSFSVIQLGTWVYGFFLDGRDAQYPVVTHTVPGIHRPEFTNNPGGTSSGFLDSNDYYSGDSQESKKTWLDDYAGISSDGVVDYSNPQGQGEGALTAVGDIDMYLQPKDGPNFKKLGIVTYTHRQCPEGLACKDGKHSLRFHYGTALALEKLTKEWGRGKLYLNSAYRTPAYNKRVGGASKSQHTQGRALDISLNSIGNSKAQMAAFGKLAVKCGFVGFGIYKSFMHIDTGRGRTWLRASEKWFVDAIKSAGWYPGKPGLSGVSVNKGTESDSSNTSSESTGSPTEFKTTGDVQQKIYDHLKSRGYSDAQIAGIMGNLKEESQFNPFAINPNDRGKESYGIAQWRGERLDALRSFSGTKYPNLDQQLAFMDHELSTTHKRAANGVRNASNASEAAQAWGSYYEVYQGHNDPSSKSFQRRMQYAQQFYQDGSLPSTNLTGFRDPTNSLPTPEYRGEPSTHMNARGFNMYSNQRRILSKDDGRMTGIPAAGEVGTFGEPELKAAPQYPYNNVTATRSGHLFELDDTPGVERLNIEHKSGTSIEMFADGSLVKRTKGNEYDMISGDSHVGILGKYFMTSVNDMHIRSTADMTIQSDGALNILMGSDGNLLISGDYLISAGEDFKVRAKKIIFEATDGIDILSHKAVNIEGREGVTIKSDKGVSIQGGEEVSMKAPNIVSDDVWRHGEGKSKDVQGAESADLGAPPPRKVVEKDNLKGTANKKGTITTEEAFKHYSGGMV